MLYCFVEVQNGIFRNIFSSLQTYPFSLKIRLNRIKYSLYASIRNKFDIIVNKSPSTAEIR